MITALNFTDVDLQFQTSPKVNNSDGAKSNGVILIHDKQQIKASLTACKVWMSPWAVEHDLNCHVQHHHFDGTTVSNGKLLSEWSHDETAVVCK